MDKTKKLLGLDREEFLEEITNNWEKHKVPTKRDELAQYMIDKAFTIKAFSTLKVMSKDNLRLICIEGEEEAKEIIKDSPTSPNIGAGVMDFLEGIREDIHKEKFSIWIKKFAINRIDKMVGKIKNPEMLDKLGIIGDILAFVFVLLELLLKHGYKDIRTKIKEFREKKQSSADASKKVEDK